MILGVTNTYFGPLTAPLNPHVFSSFFPTAWEALLDSEHVIGFEAIALRLSKPPYEPQTSQGRSCGGVCRVKISHTEDGQIELIGLQVATTAQLPI